MALAGDTVAVSVKDSPSMRVSEVLSRATEETATCKSIFSCSPQEKNSAKIKDKGKNLLDIQIKYYHCGYVQHKDKDTLFSKNRYVELFTAMGRRIMAVRSPGGFGIVVKCGYLADV